MKKCGGLFWQLLSVICFVEYPRSNKNKFPLASRTYVCYNDITNMSKLLMIETEGKVPDRKRDRGKSREVVMRHKDEELIKQIHTYIGDFYASSGRTPSTTEIASRFGIARSTAHNYLADMNRRGILSYTGGVLQVDRMKKVRTGRLQAPLLGSVPCGDLTYEEENVECVMALPTEIFGDEPCYLLHASGDSMEDEGIEDGDLIVVRQEGEPVTGDLVIALDPDGRSTLKKYGGIDEEDHKAMLLYCNRRLYPDQVIYVDELVCQGIVSHVIKKKL